MSSLGKEEEEWKKRTLNHKGVLVLVSPQHCEYWARDVCHVRQMNND